MLGQMNLPLSFSNYMKRESIRLLNRLIAISKSYGKDLTVTNSEKFINSFRFYSIVDTKRLGKIFL